MAGELLRPNQYPYVALFILGVAIIFRRYITDYINKNKLFGQNQEAETLPAHADIYVDDPTFGRCVATADWKTKTGETRWNETEKKQEDLFEVRFQDVLGRVITKPVWNNSIMLSSAEDSDTQIFKILEHNDTDTERVNEKVRKLNTRIAIRDSEVSELMTDTSTYNEKIAKMMDKMQIKNKFFFPGKQGQGGMPQPGGGGEE